MNAAKCVAAIATALLLNACVGAPSQLLPKDPIEASSSAVSLPAQFEYYVLCGKPCQSVTLTWQLDGRYRLRRGDESAMTGRMSEAAVRQLIELFAQLRELSQDLPSDLTRAAVCTRFATDHAVKVFAIAAPVNGWRFKDNLGCTGFEKAAVLRQLEANIEGILPLGVSG